MKSIDFIVILVSLLLASSGFEATFLVPRGAVTIANDLGKKVILTVRCKSGINDLGVHVLKPGESFSFEILPNLWGSTQFNCRFHYKPNDNLWFDVFRDRGTDSGHCDNCVWKITKTGPCLLNSVTNVYLCYMFKNRNPLHGKESGHH